jgi:hypothetical protein
MSGKPIVYAPIPEFDQMTQAVFQTEPVDMEDYIFVGVEIRDLSQDDGNEEMFI